MTAGEDIRPPLRLVPGSGWWNRPSTVDRSRHGPDLIDLIRLVGRRPGEVACGPNGFDLVVFEALCVPEPLRTPAYAQALGRHALAHGSSAQESLAHGTSAHDAPAHDSSAPDASAHGALTPSAPAHDPLTRDASAHGTPHDRPAHDRPAHHRPAYGTPYDKPAHDRPTHDPGDRPLPATTRFFVHEAALHVRVGDDAVMAAQFDALADRDDVPVRLVPFAAGHVDVLRSPFTLPDGRRQAELLDRIALDVPSSRSVFRRRAAHHRNR